MSALSRLAARYGVEASYFVKDAIRAEEDADAATEDVSDAEVIEWYRDAERATEDASRLARRAASFGLRALAEEERVARERNGWAEDRYGQ